MAKESTYPAILDSNNDSHSGSSAELWVRINGFLSNRSPNTATTYAGIVNEWCEFLGAPAGSDKATSLVLTATDLQAMGYRAWLEKRPGETPRMMRSKGSNSKSDTTTISTERRKRSTKDGLDSTQSYATIWKKLAALRRIYRMLVAAGLFKGINPFDSDKVPPPAKESGKKRPTQMVSFELVEKVLNQPITTTPKGRRDKAILSVLFGGGLRRSEVVKLRIGDFKRTREGTPYLYLRSTKAKRDAEQALPPWASAEVEAVIADRIRDRAKDGDYLFVSYRGKGGNVPSTEPVSANGIYRMFVEYCEKAGINEFLTPHSARATAITKLLSDGVPHREVQEFSRHSSIQMVEVYDKRRMSVDQNPARGLTFGKVK